jgi:hypothetical protein
METDQFIKSNGETNVYIAYKKGELTVT